MAGSQNPIGISISSYLPIYPSIFLSFSPSLQLSSLCTIGRNITWSISPKCQNITSPQRHDSHESKQRMALIIRQRGPRLIDALSRPEVSQRGVGWRLGLSGGTASQEIWQGGLEEIISGKRVALLLCGPRRLNKDQAGQRQKEMNRLTVLWGYYQNNSSGIFSVTPLNYNVIT